MQQDKSDILDPISTDDGSEPSSILILKTNKKITLMNEENTALAFFPEKPLAHITNLTQDRNVNREHDFYDANAHELIQEVLPSNLDVIIMIREDDSLDNMIIAGAPLSKYIEDSINYVTVERSMNKPVVEQQYVNG